MERWSASNCKRNGVNPAISAKGTTPDKKMNNYVSASYLSYLVIWLILGTYASKRFGNLCLKTISGSLFATLVIFQRLRTPVLNDIQNLLIKKKFKTGSIDSLRT